ncbi:MAG: glycosyltransferase [Candidatus Tectomicrobia bacterium]
MHPLVAQADVVVLPSYREGTPRSLLEAAAMGKPLITTEQWWLTGSMAFSCLSKMRRRWRKP